MKKVLIIIYYWPPSGGAGVQRWLKFVKYLRGYGWEPIIYTPENAEIPVVDTSLQKDVPRNLTILRTPIWEPYSVYKRFIGQKQDERIGAGFLTERRRPKFSEKISIWLRGNFFIPDARMFWIKPSIKYLVDYLKKNPVDVVVSSGPPHSMHLIAQGLKEKLNIPWLADFRDPWTNIDYYENLMLTKLADKIHHRLEANVLKNADVVVSVSESMSLEFLKGGNFNGASSKFVTITNGFDEDDFYTGAVEMDKKFSIVHIGTLVKSRNSLILWQVLSELVTTNGDFAECLEIKLIGKVDIDILESIEQYKLSKFVNKIDYLSHSEVGRLQQQSQVLLLLINNTKSSKGILTGKFFEYLSAHRPIVAIGPADGDAAKILMQTNSGKMADYNDSKGLRQIIVSYFEHYKKGELNVDLKQISCFSRRVLTGKLVHELNNIS